MLIELDGAERLYVVVEAKSSLFTDDLRDKEATNIKYGEVYFQALARGEKPARFRRARNLDDLLKQTDGEG